MTRTQKIILVFVFVFLSLWRLFEIPAVSEAFWAFCTVGALPWTDQIVPPRLVLKVMIMAFPLTLLIIFRKEFLAAVPHRRPAAMKTMDGVAPVSQLAVDENKPESTSIPRPKLKPKPEPKSKKSPVVIVLPLKTRTPLRVHARRVIGFIGKKIDIAAEKIFYYESKGARAVLRAAKVTLSTLWNGIVALGSIMRALGKLLVVLWRATEPYIRQFDHWLDVTLHQSRRISLILDTGSEVGRAAAQTAQKVQAYALKFTQRP
jgi:hypothetical protein